MVHNSVQLLLRKHFLSNDNNFYTHPFLIYKQQ